MIRAFPAKLPPPPPLTEPSINACWIDIATPRGETFSGYLSLPPTGRGPGIVLIQELWGVNEHIRALADQYALDGYVVLAPDLFWRLAPRVERSDTNPRPHATRAQGTATHSAERASSPP